MNYTDPDSARSAIDEEIRVAEIQIRKLQGHVRSRREERNKLAPISKLPFELLSLVFENYIRIPELRVSEWSMDYEIDDPELTANIQWIDIVRILAVCRTWQFTALNSPGFWSQIIFKTTPLAKAMLNLSTTSPLYIRLCAVRDVFTGNGIQALFQDKVIDALNRIRELHVNTRYTEGDWIRFPEDFRGLEAGQLQSIAINGSGDGFFDELANIFSMNMPNIRNIRVKHCNVHFPDITSPPVFHRLVSLKLAFLRTTPSRAQFYGMLSGMPALENLHLVDMLPDSPSDADSQTEQIKRVSLPHLSSCTFISSSLAQYVDFHLNVSYPIAAATLRFKPYQPAFPNTLEPMLMKLLTMCGISIENHNRSHASLLLHSYTPPSKSIKVVMWNDVGIDFFPKQASAPSSNHSPSVTLHLTNRGPIPANSVILNSFYSEGIIELGISQGIQQRPQQEWHSFFTRHSEIMHIHLYSASTNNILSSLSFPSRNNLQSETGRRIHQHAPSSGVSGSGGILCLPNLVTLTLHRHGFVSDDDGEDMAAEIDSLMTFLSARKDHIPLRKLHFIDSCGWSMDAWEKLHEVVGEVTWAGVPPYSLKRWDSDSDAD